MNYEKRGEIGGPTHLGFSWDGDYKGVYNWLTQWESCNLEFISLAARKLFEQQSTVDHMGGPSGSTATSEGCLRMIQNVV